MTAPARDLLRQACEDLAEADTALDRAYRESGLPEWRARPAEYATLARMIAYQQISTSAGGAIWGRVQSAVPDMCAETMLAAEDDTLRACGLSRPKIGHLKSIATAVSCGDLNFERVLARDTDSARAELIAVKGIGPWTAELFLLYAGGQMDAFPTADVGLMESHRMLAGLDERLDPKAFTGHAENWRPWRGVAAHLLWGWINTEREKKRQASPQA